MARVILDLGRAYRGDLPPICICCGAEAMEYRDKMFSLSPFGIPFFFLPYIAILPGRIWLRAPYCEEHKTYWRRRLTRIVAGLILSILPGIVGFPILLDASNQSITRFGARLCLIALVTMLAWMVMTIRLQWMGIRLARHDPPLITLSGVSDKFAEAIRIEQERPESRIRFRY